MKVVATLFSFFLLLLGSGYSKELEFDSILREEWNAWKVMHGKEYGSMKEETERSYVWLDNKRFIDEHNCEADVHGYTLRMNHFGDMTHSEWTEMHLGYTSLSNMTKINRQIFSPPSPPDFPKSLDWRNHNAVVHVKDQLKCNSSYAFSAVAALEGAMALAHDKLVALSEQNIIDCSVPYGNHGCHGGNTYLAYQYVIDADGLDLDVTYPYKSMQTQCHYHPSVSGARMTGVVNIEKGSERDLLAAVATVGPISIGLDASSNSFRFYAGGIFDTIHCSATNLNHAMVIIGYGTNSNGKKYWMAKNSWGPHWGEGGYIKLVRDSFNQCGVASDASYPTL